MTRDEAKRIIVRVRNLYISQSRQFTDLDWQAMIDTWHEELKADTYEDVNRALSAYVNKGKQFIPTVADIINELMNLIDPRYKGLFTRLKRECEIMAEGIEHAVIDDYGGIIKDSESPTGYRFVVAEAHMTDKYTQMDFANMPIELQVYAEDLRGLSSLQREIASSERFAFKRFVDHMTHYDKERGANEYSNYTR